MATQIIESIHGAGGPAPSSMWAMVLTGVMRPLAHIHVPVPLPGSHDLLLRVSACGVRRSDTILVGGQVPGARYPIIPGHEVVGDAVQVGHHVQGYSVGDRVGVPRLGWACGKCPACQSGFEHLCRSARLTGQTQDGGMAQYICADYRFCVHLPSGPPASALAPLLCEGATAYRALRVLGEARRIGLYGPAPATGLAVKLARLRGQEALVLHDGSSRATDLDGALVFAPAQDLVRHALEAVVDGGLVVWVDDISDDPVGVAIPLPTRERQARSVAGATRRDVVDLIALVTTSPIQPAVETFQMAAAEEALARLRTGRVTGSVVLLAD
jgi:alcohol dehydrogenase, propanol-preferring